MRSFIKIFPIALLLLEACNKKLDIEPKESIDATTAITTPEDLEGAVVGAYSLIAGPDLYGTNFMLIPDLLASTQYLSWVGTFTDYAQIARRSMTRDNDAVSDTWQSAYSAINMANIVLNNLNVVGDDEDLKAQYEGEALFIRGITHFELVRLYALPWGATPDNSQLGVVIKTTATTTEEQASEAVPRSTVAQVYQQVISDLTAAASKLPEDNGTRADKYTALAFLSRVYLQQQDYQNALMAADSVINSGKYAMNASVNAVFDNKNTNESIFEIQQNDQNNAGTSNSGMATFYASLEGIGRADVRVSEDFLASVYNENDLRKQQWYYEGVGQRSGIFTSKWKSYSQNLPIVRIAEMYLTRAECNLRLGTATGATPAKDLEQVRNPIRTGMPVISSPTLQDVLDERFRELTYEGVRIHDLRRLKEPTGDFEWNSNDLVLPIPQRDVEASKGVIEQNPGY
jgi:starch-binding outer membrane protein, SusD/RagB family